MGAVSPLDMLNYALYELKNPGIKQENNKTEKPKVVVRKKLKIKNVTPQDNKVDKK